MGNFVEQCKRLPDLLMGEGSQNELIEMAEKKLGLFFAKDYTEYLRKFGVMACNGHELTGLGASSRLNVVDVTLEERQRNLNISPDWYVIEQTNIDGMVIWQSETGEIYQAVNEAGKKICGSLMEYIENF